MSQELRAWPRVMAACGHMASSNETYVLCHQCGHAAWQRVQDGTLTPTKSNLRLAIDDARTVKPEDLTYDQHAQLLWLFFVDKFKVLSAKQKIVYLAGFIESIDKNIAGDLV